MVTNISTKPLSAPINSKYGFDLMVNEEVIHNFRSYAAADFFLRKYNKNRDRIKRENVKLPPSERQKIPPVMVMRYFCVPNEVTPE